MSYYNIKTEDIVFNRARIHNPGASIMTETPITFITPYLRVSSYPRQYIALRDSDGNDIERVNLFTEVEDTRFLKWLDDLQDRCKKELKEQKIDENPDEHWNVLIAHNKYLRSKLHVRPSKMLQLDAFEEGSEEVIPIDLDKVTNYFYPDVYLRLLLELRPILFKNNRAGISFRVIEVEFKKPDKSKLVTTL